MSPDESRNEASPSTDPDTPDSTRQPQPAETATAASNEDDQPVRTTEDSVDEADGPNTLMNALIGAAITFVTTFFIPFAPLLGGAVAGYLQEDDGLKVGAISGAMALVPLLIFVPLVLVVFLFEPFAAFALLIFALFLLAFLTAYTVGLSAVGGLIGVYLYEEL